METLIRKLRQNRQELVKTLSSGSKFGHNEVKSESLILEEMDKTLDQMENRLSYTNLGILHRFFNSKSDANKYLTAEKQEELENDFDEWMSKNGEYNNFKASVEPAIRYLLQNCDPYTKIYIDYSRAELVQSRNSHNLNNEIPD